MAVEDDIAAQIRISDAAPSHAVPVLTSQAPAGPAGPSFSAPAKLEPFLLLAKSTKGAGAAKLVEQATAAPGIFVFGELLDLPNIREVRHSAAVRPLLWMCSSRIVFILLSWLLVKVTKSTTICWSCLRVAPTSNTLVCPPSFPCAFVKYSEATPLLRWRFAPLHSRQRHSANSFGEPNHKTETALPTVIGLRVPHLALWYGTCGHSPAYRSI